MSKMLTSSVLILAVWGLLLGSIGHCQPPGNATVREPRPQNADLQVQKLPQALENLLTAWSQKSAQIQNLQGQHFRHVYDMVFNVEKRSTGVFYYEAPGKGRIDLKPAPIQEGEKSLKAAGDGTPFKLQPDRSEKWICNGTDIWQVNDQTKQIDIIRIPKENQGQNIMDGPMPFLFGMPPEKAKRRYHLELVQDGPQEALIKVLPRWQVDAANWKEAQVILNKTLYLPTAVKLIDPSGNLETVYRFGEFQINKEPGILVKLFGGEKDPFNPALRGYTKKVHEGAAAAAQEPAVPSVAGLGWEDAKKLLERLGCKVQIARGQKAPRNELTYVVYDQKPAAKTPLKPGIEVVLTVYDQGPVQPAGQQPAGQAPVPAVIGLHWKEAGQKLEQAGYKVKYLPGEVAPSADKLYIVYQQTPNAGAQPQAGAEVTVTVYNTAQEAKK